MKKMKWVGAVAVIVVAAVALVGVGIARAQGGSGATKAPAKAAFNRALLNPGTLNTKAPETFDVRFTTTKGDFVIRVTRAWSPLGADRFYNLVRNGFFNGTAFFRTLPGFVVQFGLSPHPEVSRAWRTATIQDDPVRQSNRRGFVTYAMGGANTRTTQVFINFGDNARLDASGFSPFGQVIEGMDVVDKFYSGYGERPDQGQIQAQGAAYLDKSFPNLDKVITAKFVTAPPAGGVPATAKKGQ